MNAPDVLAAVERALCAHFGQRPVRASVSFLGVESIEMLRFQLAPGERAYVSLGMSRYPMTTASHPLPRLDGPRAELVMHIRDESGSCDEVWRRLAVLAASPAVEGLVYTPDMTVDLGQSVAPGSRCTGGVIVESALAAIRTPEGPVALFQVLPATASELAWSRVRGAAGLRERWAAQRVDLLDLARCAVALD